MKPDELSPKIWRLLKKMQKDFQEEKPPLTYEKVDFSHGDELRG